MHKNTFFYLRAVRDTMAYLLLGSNEGDRLQQLKAAARLLSAAISCGQASASAIYETAAWGKEDQPPFLNAVVRLPTAVAPQELLRITQRIEHQFGRQRAERWGQRTLDIDILFYGSAVVLQPGLTIPHPQLPARRFALVPMAELAPAFVHPSLQQTMTQLLAACPDPLPVRRLPAADFSLNV